MKKAVFTGLFSGVLLLGSSFVNHQYKKQTADQIQKDFVQISDKLLMDKFEVSNVQYRLFLAYLKETQQVELLQKCFLDTAKWKAKPMEMYYHSNQAFDNYPVVTVSYESANEYCKWITGQYLSDPDRKFNKVVFRLPTEQEWISAANGGDINKIYPWDNSYLRNKKGEYLCNFLRLGDQSITYDETTKSFKIIGEIKSTTTYLAEVKSYYPAKSGIYNLSGNAAEMVSQKGLAKGGSFNDPGFDVRIASKKFYKTPSPEIGFRLIMEVLEK